MINYDLMKVLGHFGFCPRGIVQLPIFFHLWAEVIGCQTDFGMGKDTRSV